MQYHAAELLDSHRHLDTIGVPRRSPEGEPLSISQRTKLAADLVTSLFVAQQALAKAAGR